MRIKLKQAFDLQMGKTPARNLPEYWDGDRKWVSIADIGQAGKYISKTKECITDAGVRGSGIKIVPKGTVIMSFKLSIGKTAITAEDMYTNEAIMAFIDKGVYKIDSSYFYHLCCGKDWTAGTNKAVMGLTLNKATLSEIEIPLPDISVQREIAAILDKIDAIMEKRREQLDELDRFVKSRFIELFGDPECNPYGWPCKLLGQLVVVEPQNGMYKPQTDYVQDGSGIPILRIDAFYNGKVTNFRKLKRLNCTEVEKQRYLLREHDIVINRVNSIEYLGKCAHICGMVEDTVFESNMMRFHLDESVMDAVYATHFLCSQYIYKQILRKAKKAVNQASINQSDVTSFELLVPPFPIQKQFAAFVEQTDKSKFGSLKSLEELEILKKSLMQQYFG